MVAMEYDMEPKERQLFFNARGKTIVTACPGSGKTTSIVNKMYTVCREVEGESRHSGVLCLSFTNKAVDEIRTAYSKLHKEDLAYPHGVSTIDSFITQEIVLPYWYLCEKCKSSPVIINEPSLLHSLFWRHYSQKGQVKEKCVIQGYGVDAIKFKPEDVQIASGIYYHKTNKLSSKLQIYGEKVVNYRIQKGYLTSSDAIYVALAILDKCPQIAKLIVKRYPYIIVDEAQDTSEDQYKLMFKLCEAGLKNLELIGDVNQSIYEWRFARPDLLEALLKDPDWAHISFINNRRSVQRIIDFYSKLIPADRALPIVSTKVQDIGLPIIIYRYDKSNSGVIISHFEKICQDNGLHDWLILTRGHSLGKMLSGRKEEPDYWKSPMVKNLLNAYISFKYGNMRKAVQQLSLVWAEFIYKESEYEKKKEFVKDTIDDFKKSTYLINSLFKMPGLDETFHSWTVKMPKFIQETFGLDKEPNIEVYMRKKKFDIKEMAQNKLSDFFGCSYENNGERLIQTIHSVKGASTDAVLLFVSESSKGKQISLNEFNVGKNMTEKQRMIYVACSRARQFLAIAVPSTYSTNNISKMLNGINYELKAPGLQDELFKK